MFIHIVLGIGALGVIVAILGIGQSIRTGSWRR
jgi:hypothetical protein